MWCSLGFIGVIVGVHWGQTLFAVYSQFAAWYIVRMARPLRIEFPNAIYDVMAPGNRLCFAAVLAV